MSSEQSLVSTVVAILSGVLDEPASALEAEPTLASHEWDSLSSLEALAQLEALLGVTLDLRSFHAARTVADLVHLVASAKAGSPAAARP
jgi:acyl carrier protein